MLACGSIEKMRLLLYTLHYTINDVHLNRDISKISNTKTVRGD